MSEVTNYQQELHQRIAPIVERLFRSNSLYLVRLKEGEMIEMLIELFSQLSPEEMHKIQEHDLLRRIDKILVSEAVSGTLNDLTPEQIRMYDEAVKRK